jgi:formamidopyrimidine-DNA glycosylase
VERVFRWGKQVLFQCKTRCAAEEHTQRFLAVHLRMTGRLLIGAHDTSPKHLRARLVLDEGAVLFVDTRRFGTLEVYENLEQASPAGVDPTTADFTIERLTALLKRGRSEQPLKPWLLRQDRLVGLGNIYASEICFIARLDPRRAASGLNADEIRRLHGATCEVLSAAIDACGTTFSDFQDAHGVTGSYQQFLSVYGRNGLPCRSCDRSIDKIIQAQRSTFFCSHCQR